MNFISLVLFLCFSTTELGRVWALQQTDVSFSGVRQRDEDSPRADLGARSVQRWSPGRGRMSREVQGGGVTIDTLPDNVTRRVEDSGRYYTWRSFGPEDRRTNELWIDMSDLQHGQVRMHSILSNTHKQAARIPLTFDFPFYGHHLRQVTVATGGFIFMGDVVHRMLTATQYVAPLMANFDPSFSQESTVQYLDNGEVFVVQWDRVRLHGREPEGAFTFQAALHRTGSITFSYRDVPLPVEAVGSAQHPVKAGLSDAFMVALPSPGLRGAPQRTIYEYHRVEIETAKITNHSAFQFTALPACLQHKSCESCLSSNQTFGCSWCNVLQRCSDGMDRHRQEWLDYSCSESKDAACDEYSREGADGSVAPSVAPEQGTDAPKQRGCKTDDLRAGFPKHADRFTHVGVMAGVVAAAVLLLALVLLALYINYHPAAASTVCLFRKQAFQPGYTEVEGRRHEREIIVESGPC